MSDMRGQNQQVVSQVNENNYQRRQTLPLCRVTVTVAGVRVHVSRDVLNDARTQHPDHRNARLREVNSCGKLTVCVHVCVQVMSRACVAVI